MFCIHSATTVHTILILSALVNVAVCQCAGWKGDVRKVVYVRGYCWLTTTDRLKHPANLALAGTHYAHPRYDGGMAVLPDDTVRSEVWRALTAAPRGIDIGQLIFVNGVRDLPTTVATPYADRHKGFEWIAADGTRLPINQTDLAQWADETALPWELSYHALEIYGRLDVLDNAGVNLLLAGLFQYRPRNAALRFQRVPGGWESHWAVLSSHSVHSPQTAVRHCQLVCARSMLCLAFTALIDVAQCRLHYELRRVVEYKVHNEHAALFYIL